MLEPENRHKRIILTAFYAFLIIAAAFVFFKYLFSPLFPFLAAFAISALTRPALRYVCKRTGLPKKLASVLFTLILISILASLIWVCFSRLFYELVQLVGLFSSDAVSDFLDTLSVRISDFLHGLPGGKFSREFTENITEKIRTIDKIALSALGKFTPQLIESLMGFAKKIPGALVSLIFIFIALFYIGLDYENIIAFICAQLSPKAKNTLFEIKRQFCATCADLFKAYFLITLITFAELLVGFLILRIKYAVLLALLVSFVDMLPVLGTGSVLVPWGLIALILGKNGVGIGILVLYGTITVIRQIIEPKIVGNTIGLYPLITLMAMYAGTKLIGFAGLFIFPITAIVIKSLNDKGIFSLYKTPDATDAQKLAQSKQKYANFKKDDNNAPRKKT